MDQGGKIISPEMLVPMDLFSDEHPIRIELAYQRSAAPNIFGKIYGDNARLWLHVDLAKITLLAARSIHQRHGHVSVLYDGLRTIEAQSLMASSPIARANPHWLEQPNRLLSPPGGGAHPRGMAIDLSLIDEDGKMLDMGTVFDHLAEDPSPAHNPAHRDYIGLTDEVRQNRAILTGAMIDAAAAFDMPLLPLPQEWWDFRFTAEYYGGFAPLSDENLPPEMRMTQICTAGDSPANLSDSHFDALKDSVERDVNQRLD